MLKANMRHYAKIAGIVFEIALQQAVRRVIGVAGGHWVIFVLRKRLRTNDMRRFVYARMGAIFAIGPVTAHLAALLEHNNFKAASQAIFCRRDAAWPGPNHAHSRNSCHMR